MYGVVNSNTRKITQPYGVIGGITKKISKIYGVVEGVTKLIYSSGVVVEYPISFFSGQKQVSVYDAGEVEDYALNGAIYNSGWFTTIYNPAPNTFIAQLRINYGSAGSTFNPATVTFPKINGSYSYLINHKIILNGSGIIAQTGVSISSTSTTSISSWLHHSFNDGVSYESSDTDKSTVEFSISGIESDTVVLSLSIDYNVYMNLNKLYVE